MREKMLLKMIAPYVKNSQLTYDDFDRIFGNILTHRDQYIVVDHLEEKGIHLVDILDSDVEVNGIQEEVSDQELGEAHKQKESTDKGIGTQDRPLLGERKIYQTNEQLCILIQRGSRQAMQDLCIKNKRLVQKVAWGYQKITTLLDCEDLEQIGYGGLIRAAMRFCPEKETQFSTYAMFWVKQVMGRAIKTEDLLIRLPVNMHDTVYKIAKYDNELWGQGVEDLEERIDRIASSCEMEATKVRKIMMYRDRFFHAVSLDAPIGEDRNTSLGELLPAAEETSVENQVCNKQMVEEVNTVLGTLTEKEADIIRRRFGLKDGHEETLEEIGKIYGVTRERIRQIEVKAIRRLRHPSRSRRLRDYKA